MKSIEKIIGAGVIILVSAVHCLAIPGIQVSLQCSNVVLTWPSVEGQTYIVRYRPTLDPSTPWQTLTSSWPAAVETNLTFFVHSNIVQHPNCGSGGSLADMAPIGASLDSLSPTVSEAPSVPMVMPADGSGVAVPLAIFPPGFDLSGFSVYDPTTAEWVSGAAYSAAHPYLNASLLNGLQPMDGTTNGGVPQPMDGGSGDSGTNSYPPDPPDIAFYEVVQQGIQMFGVTNEQNLSGIVTITNEAASLVGTLDGVTFSVDGQAIPGATDLASPISQPLTFFFDTARLPNGAHQIQAQATWRSPVTGSGVDPYSSVSSPPISFTVFNEISYPAWMDIFGQDSTGAGACDFVATSATPLVNWQLDVFDSQYQYIGSLGAMPYRNSGIDFAN